MKYFTSLCHILSRDVIIDRRNEKLKRTFSVVIAILSEDDIIMALYLYIHIYNQLFFEYKLLINLNLYDFFRF